MTIDGSSPEQTQQSRLADELMHVGGAGAGEVRRRSGRGVISALLSIALASCSAATFSTADRNDVDVVGKVRSLDLKPRYPRQVGPELSPQAKAARAMVYTGTGTDDGPGTNASNSSAPVAEVHAEPAAFTQSVGDGFELNFENTPVATIAKVVLGDILGVGYVTRSARAGGHGQPRLGPTLSPRPISSTCWRARYGWAGFDLVRDSGGYRLIPLGDAVGAGNVDGNGSRPEAGYGVSVMPLQYVSAQTLVKLLDSFALKPGMVRADPGRNLLLIQGSGARPPRRGGERAELRCRLDARTIGRGFPDRQRQSGADRRRAGEDHGHRRERPRSECRQIPDRQPHERRSW